MLEDLFKMVKDRFNEEQKDEAEASAPEIPKDLLFKCPRCQNVFYMDEFEKRKRPVLSATIMQDFPLRSVLI